MQIQYCTWCVKKHVDIFLKNIFSYVHSGISVEFVVVYTRTQLRTAYSLTMIESMIENCGGSADIWTKQLSLPHD
jgi:hypothetical protein